MTREQWTWIIAAGAIVIALVAGFAIGRVTAGGSTQESSVEVEETTVPQYGDSAARDAYTTAVRGSLPLGTPLTDEELLVAGDSLCANLEGFTNQGRDAHYAIRIIWTDQLRYLDSKEVAVFGVVLAAAPEYLCPQYRVLAEDVSYWLGI